MDSLVNNIKRLKQDRKQYSRSGEDFKPPYKIKPLSQNSRENISIISKQADSHDKQMINQDKKQQKQDSQHDNSSSASKQLQNWQAKKGVEALLIAPKNLFSNIKFCFPKYNVELTQNRAKQVANTIEQYGGEVLQLEDLKAMAYETDECAAVDFMLVGKDVLRESVQEDIKDEIAYEDILYFDYIFKCKKKGKLLKIKKFIIPYKSEELQNYVKQKKVDEELERQSLNHYQRKIWTYTPGTGIQPTDNFEFKHSSQMQFQGQSFNKDLADAFQKLRSLHQLHDKNRAFLYERIANIFQKPSTPKIYTQQDASKLSRIRFFGPQTINKVKEFVKTGTIKKMDLMAGKPQNLARAQLQKIYGIGIKKAHELYVQGIQNIDHLRTAVECGQITLTKNQMLGLKYYEELNQRIPYQKVTKIFEYVKKIFYKIVLNNQLHYIEVCGSYRRKKSSCGDIDIIIARKDGHYEKDLLLKLVNRLTELEFLTDHLTELKKSQLPTDAASSMSFMGICKFESEQHHRIDIKYYPLEQYPFAILYFTGSSDFNKHMRNHALKKGYTLTDHGIWEVERCGKQLMPRGNVKTFANEEDIFTFLRLKYKKPEERSV